MDIGKKQTAVGNAFDAMGRSWVAYMAGFGGVALADALVESFRVSDLAILPMLFLFAAVGAVLGLIHLICLGLLTLPLEWGRRKKLSDPLYRRLIRLSSVLIGVALPTAFTILLLPWQTGYDVNFAGHSVTLASLYQSWLLALLLCVSGGYFAGRQWGQA